MQKEQATASSRRVMLVMMSLSTLYNYLYCMMACNSFAVLPVFGGALYMGGRVAIIYGQTFVGENRAYLSRKTKIGGTVLLVLMMIYVLVLMSMFPTGIRPDAAWILFTIALTLTIRSVWGRRLVSHRMRGTLKPSAFVWLFAALQLVPIGLMALLFFVNLEPTAAWQTLGGYALGSLLECYSLWRERKTIAESDEQEKLTADEARRMKEELHGVHAYSAYQQLYMLVLMALQVTLVMVYTFIGMTTAEFFTCMVLSVGCTVLMREAVDWLLRLMTKRKPALTQMLLIGLFLWIYGLMLFYRQLGGTPNMVMSYLSLGLCTSGLSLAVTCLAELERDMTDVAAYGLQNNLRGYDHVRSVATELSILLGQLVALLLLTFLCVSGLGITELTVDDLVRSFRPLMIVPPALLLIGAVIALLRFPINSRYFQKLRRFLSGKGAPENPSLRKQLDNVVVAKHKNRFGVKLIILLMRPFYYHKVVGIEHTAPYEDGTMVLVCNHGELYGPIVTNLYLPISFRPWTISSMMEPDAVVEYIYENTMKRQKWIPERLKMPITKRIIGPFFVWVFSSIEAIPVYRGNPRSLFKTFRGTVEAMQAGDNILVFPERGDAAEKGQRGYVTEGVSDLYTGFAMIAPALYAKTQQRAVFVPIYASKHLRTITFGECVVYDPTAPANDEKLRIVSELQRRMEDMYAVELDTLAKRKEERRRLLQSRRHRLKKAELDELEALEREAAEKRDEPKA